VPWGSYCPVQVTTDRTADSQLASTRDITACGVTQA